MRLSVRKLIAIPLAGLVLFAAACGDSSGPDPDPDPDPEVGTIAVAVSADGEAAAGVDVRLFTETGTDALEVATTNTSGEARFTDVEVGTYAVEVSPPVGMMLGEGETARKTVAVTAGGTADLSFALVEDPETPVVEVLVRSDNLTFDPDVVEIAPGTTVRWRATGSITHTVTPDGHMEWSSAVVSEPGDVFTHTFGEAGEFDYYCQPHRAQNMVGTVRVVQ